MTDNINAEIIAIGTEILLGEITDTNSVFLARKLRDLGINLYFMTTVGDNEERISSAIHSALERAQLVITCGGLGPTLDDMTRQSIANATDRGLTFHQYLYDQIAERFSTFRSEMTENNRQQAFLPDDAIIVENPVGTAPSFMVEHGDGVVISLPGVPREMKFLFTKEVVPYLKKRFNLGVIKSRILKTAGIGESSLDDLIGRKLLNNANPSIGLSAHQGVIDVRITAKAENSKEAEQALDGIEYTLRRKIGQYVFGIDDAILEVTLIEELVSTGQTIAVLEAGLEDAIVSKLLPFNNGATILADVQQVNHPDDLNLGVTELKDKAEQIAKKIYHQHDVVASIAILSYPDVDENPDKEASTAVCVYTSEHQRVRIYGFGGKSNLARDWVSRWAMSVLWQMLREQNNYVD